MTQNAVPTPRLSVQFYSVRNQLAADLDGIIGQLADLGVQHVEPYTVFDRPDELTAVLARYGLSASTAHTVAVRRDRVQGRSVPLPPLTAALQAGQVLGAEVVFDPMTSPERWCTPDEVAATADRLNAAAWTAAGRPRRTRRRGGNPRRTRPAVSGAG